MVRRTARGEVGRRDGPRKLSGLLVQIALRALDGVFEFGTEGDPEFYDRIDAP